jgi:prepilin-type N-terminal cleavage/methylation domain-containing protein
MRAPKLQASAFTLVEIMIVVAIIGLLAAIAIPNFVRTRERAQENGCINNLRQIDASKQQWALEQRRLGSDVPALSDIAPYMVRASGGRIPSCPANSSTNFAASYSILEVTNPPVCVTPGVTHVLPF